MFSSIFDFFETEEQYKKRLRELLSDKLNKYIPSKEKCKNKFDEHNEYIVFHLDWRNNLHFRHHKTVISSIKLDGTVYHFDAKISNNIDLKRKLIGVKCVVEELMEKLKDTPEIIKVGIINGYIYQIKLVP